MAVSTLHDLYRVYLTTPQEDGNVNYRLAGRFALHGDQLDILEDHMGVIASNIHEGHVNVRTRQAIEALKHSAYMKIVSEHSLNSGEDTDLIEPLDGGEGLASPVVEGTTIPQAPADVFHYYHAGMEHPQVLEAIDDKVLMNGNELAPDEMEQVIANIQSGNASLRYPKAPVGERVLKMEQALEELSKVEKTITPAMRELRAAVDSGHISPESLKVITHHMFVDAMVPGVGNRFAYRDFLARSKKGIHVRIDANDFGGINKDHGFETGDGAIRALGGALRASMDNAVGQKHGKLFRIGGDEFHAFVPNHEQAARFLRTAREQLGSIPPIGGTHNLSFSAGMGPSPFHAEASLMAAKRAKKSMGYLLGQAKNHVYSSTSGHIPIDTDKPPLIPPPPEAKGVPAPTVADVAVGMPPPKQEIPLQEVQKAEGADFLAQVQDQLTDDLRKPRYQGNVNPMAGHCYVASEAMYHLLGGVRSGYTPQQINHEGESHWYLRHKETGKILDPTANQFETPVPYEKGRGKGFLTAHPSVRARTVIAGITKKHGPQVKKAEPEDLKPLSVVSSVEKVPTKPANGQPMWYQDETSSSRFPSQFNPKLAEWKESYIGALKEYFGKNLKPVKIRVATAVPNNAIHKPDRRDLYSEMIRNGAPIPPVVASPYDPLQGGHQIKDGSHRLDAAQRAGLEEIDGYEIVPSEVPPQFNPNLIASSPQPEVDQYRFMRDVAGRLPWEAGFTKTEINEKLDKLLSLGEDVEMQKSEPSPRQSNPAPANIEAYMNQDPSARFDHTSPEPKRPVYTFGPIGHTRTLQRQVPLSNLYLAHHSVNPLKPDTMDSLQNDHPSKYPPISVIIDEPAAWPEWLKLNKQPLDPAHPKLFVNDGHHRIRAANNQKVSSILADVREKPTDRAHWRDEDIVKSEPAALEKMAALDPNAGYTFEYGPYPHGPSWADPMVQVTAHHNGQRVGHVTFSVNGNTMKPCNVEVVSEHRRKGLASAMYAHAESKAWGRKIVPSGMQTPDGQALWAGNERDKQFGKVEPTKKASFICPKCLARYAENGACNCPPTKKL